MAPITMSGRTFNPSPMTWRTQVGLVAAYEGVEVDDHAIRTIAKHHRGDLRNSLGALQKVAYLPEKERRSSLTAWSTVAST